MIFNLGLFKARTRLVCEIRLLSFWR